MGRFKADTDQEEGETLEANSGELCMWTEVFGRDSVVVQMWVCECKPHFLTHAS